MLEKNQLKQDERARVGAFYGQFPVFVILPVNARIVLRANPCFPRFARNRPSCFTGKSLFSAFCP
ncbi:vitamin B12-binding protein [Ligilactobacillus ruminis]|uniref:vitamin B12-binding protein n=1 Tax=Ligilactobacillus ruminis TaxID=1623 RepID=UPI00265ABA06|nr:vitamin B12-binding protein [Ligilactobacillus ruminis]WKB71151.1 vitamin B12-binding protein [Ligilactobacillus ruminis]